MSSPTNENISLTSSVVTTGTTIYLERVTIDVVNHSILLVWQLLDSGGNLVAEQNAFYPTPAPTSNPTQPTGATLIHALNTGNFSTNSLIKKIYQQLQTDGYVGAGTISGTQS